MKAKSLDETTIDAPPAATREIYANTAVLLLCAILVTLAATAALLLTLRSTLDAVAGTPPVTANAPAAVDERHAGQVIADWVDSLSESELRTWRLRLRD